MVFKKGQKAHNKIEIDLELMKSLYFDKKWNYRKIADYFGLKSKSAIYDRFKLLGLVARNNTDLKTGFKHSEKTKKRISIKLTGRKYHSEEYKKKLSERTKGKNNPMWKGGRMRKGGYVYVNCCNHPNADRKGYVAEHRLVMEAHLGRYLTKKEVVHHINRIRDDNRLENLKLFENQSKHLKYHFLKK